MQGSRGSLLTVVRFPSSFVGNKSKYCHCHHHPQWQQPAPDPLQLSHAGRHHRGSAHTKETRLFGDAQQSLGRQGPPQLCSIRYWQVRGANSSISPSLVSNLGGKSWQSTAPARPPERAPPSRWSPPGPRKRKRTFTGAEFEVCTGSSQPQASFRSCHGGKSLAAQKWHKKEQETTQD